MSEMNSSENVQDTPAVPPTPPTPPVAPAVPAPPAPPATPVAQTPAPTPAQPAAASTVYSMPLTPQQPAATDAASTGYGAPHAAQFGAQSVPNPQNVYQAPQTGQGFFARLFDLSFSQYHSKPLAKLTYILALVAIWLAWFVHLVKGTIEISSYSSGGATIIFFFTTLVVGGLIAFVITLFTRFTLEFFVATVSNAEDTRRLRELKEKEEEGE